MFFTQEDYRKVEKWLLSNSRKDTDFVGAATPLKGNETVVLVQNGKNVKTSVKDVVEQLFLLGVSDFVNITDKYGESYISLSQAIELIPYRSRKVGQVITFLDETGKWSMYQFQGLRKNQWNTLSLWVDLIDLMKGMTVVDSEDIVTEVNSANQTSLKFADKTYNEADYSGLGRIYLRKNVINVEDPVTGNIVKMNYLTQSMISKKNTIYIIQYDYSLNGQTIIIPDNCVLKFEGGQLKNGTVVFNKTNIIEPSSTIFKNIVLNGTIENQYINIGWFKDVADYSNLIENLLKIGNIYFPNGTYKFSTIVKIDTDDRIIAGNNIENTIITAIDSNPLNFLSVRANNISIKNLSFIDNPEGYPSKGTAQGARASYEIEVRENATNTIISNCSFKQATGGIFAYQGAVGLQIINCIFEDMVYIPRDINNLPLGGAGGYGVVCHFDGDNNHNIGVKDVLIKNNTFKDTIYRHAIYIQNVYNCIVEDNTSYHTNEEKASGYESHMMYYGGQGVNIVNNYFYGGCGALTTSADAKGNNASFFTFSNNHIIDWQCYKSGNGGIALSNMSNCIISNNVFNSAYKCAAIKISKNCDFVKIINNSINTGNEAPTGIAQLAPISSDSGFPTLKNIDIINNTITTQYVYCCYFRFINSSNVLTDGIRNIKITNNTLSSTNTGIRIQNSNIFSNILISGNTFLMPTPLSLFEVNSPSTGKEGIILTNNYWENGDFLSKLGDYLYILVINNIIGKGGNNDDYVGRMLLPSGNHLIPAKGNYLGPEIVPGVKCDYGDVIINRTTTRQAPVMWMCISGGIAGTDNVRFIPIYGKLYGTTNERESIDFSTLSPQEKSDLSLGMIYFDSDLRKPVVYNGSYWTYFDGWNVEYLRSGTTAQRPILNANQVPFQYYDTNLKKFINWNGTAWVNLDGTALI